MGSGGGMLPSLLYKKKNACVRVDYPHKDDDDKAVGTHVAKLYKLSIDHYHHRPQGYADGGREGWLI